MLESVTVRFPVPVLPVRASARLYDAVEGLRLAVRLYDPLIDEMEHVFDDSEGYMPTPWHLYAGQVACAFWASALQEAVGPAPPTISHNAILRIASHEDVESANIVGIERCLMTLLLAKEALVDVLSVLDSDPFFGKPNYEDMHQLVSGACEAASQQVAQLESVTVGYIYVEMMLGAIVAGKPIKSMEEMLAMWKAARLL